MTKNKLVGGSMPTVLTQISSAAVEKTKKMFPSTQPIGFQLDSAKKASSGRLRTLVAATSKIQTQSVVQSPASIVELARSLNLGPDGPQLIFEHVYNNIEWEPGWGVQKGALGALLDGLGNSFDQSLLLASLLREAGFTANIVHGTIRLRESEYSDWWNVSSIWAAQAYCLNQFIPIVTAPTWTGSEWYMDIRHVWVEWDDGGTLYQFDPSVKTYNRKSPLPALDTVLGYSASSFQNDAEVGATLDTSGDWVEGINRANIRDNLDSYSANLVNYLRANSIGTAAEGTATVDDVLGGQSIVPVTLPVLNTSLPYQQPGDVPTVWSGDVPNSFKPTLQIQFPNWSSPGVWDFTYQTTSDMLAGKRLTLWYDGSLTPELFLDGTVVATGLSQPANSWTSLFFTVEHPAHDAANYPLPFQQWYQTTWQFWQSFIYSGGNYLVANAWGNLGEGQQNVHIKNAEAAEAAGSAVSSEVLLGSRMAISWMKWASQNSKLRDLINKLTNCHTVYNHQIGILAFDAAASNAMSIDLGGVSGSSTNLDNDVTKTPINDTTLAMHGVALEAAMCVQMNGKAPGICTSSVLDKANADGDRLYKGTTANWNVGTDIQNELTLNGYNLSDLQDVYNWYIQWGDSVVIGAQPVKTMGIFSGWSYWAFPVAGAYGITNATGKYGGGQDGRPGTPPTTPPGPTGQPTSSEPIGLFSGDYFYEHSDIKLGSEFQSFPYSLSFDRHYSSAGRFYANGLGWGWSHNHDISVSLSSNGLLAMGKGSAIQGASTIAELFVAVDIISDTARPIEKLVALNVANAWWIDQIVNNTVVLSKPSGSLEFVRMADGTFVGPANMPGSLFSAGGTYSFRTVDGTEYNFNSDGRISTLVDPGGVTVSYTYSSGKLSSVSNGMGRTLSLHYTSDRITSVTDGTGRSISYDYDLDGNLVGFTDSESNETVFGYDLPGRLIQIFMPANPSSPIVTNEYDSLDRVKTQTDANNNEWSYFFAGARTVETDPLGNSKTIYFNADGMPVREIDALNHETVNEYDGLNRLIRQVRPEGDFVSWSYDHNSNVLTETITPKPGSGLSARSFVNTYDALWGKLETHTDFNGNTTTYSYDAVTGRLLSVEREQVGAIIPTVTHTYNSRGQILTTTDEVGKVNKYTYDPVFESILSAVEDFDVGLTRLNLTTAFDYDDVGNIVSVTDPNGNETTFAYDLERRKTQIVSAAPFGFTTNFVYDENGNLSELRRSTGDLTEPWKIDSWTYSVSDKVLTRTDSSGKVWTRTYDARERLASHTDPEMRQVQYEYDELSRIDRIIDSSSTVADSRSYTNNGLLASQEDGRGKVTSWTYDGFDRPIRITYADSTYEEISSYDDNSNILRQTTRGGDDVVMTYDELNRPVSKQPDGESAIIFEFDAASKLVSASRPLVSGDPSTGIFERVYDTAGRCITERYPDGKEVNFELDNVGSVIKIIHPDGYYIQQTFDELHRLSNIKLNGSSVKAVEFTYDQLSRRTTLAFNNGTSVNYVYDSPSRDDLTDIVHNFVGASVSLGYGYNDNHEIVSKTVSDNAFMWHPATGGTTTYGVANDVNAYPTVGGATFAYDNNGCLTNDGIWSFAYSVESQLISANKTGTSVLFKYDPFNRQVQKDATVGGVSTVTNYVYSGLSRIADYDVITGSLLRRYVFGPIIDEPLLEISSAGSVSYYHADHQNSVIAVSDVVGALASSNNYGPFGETLASGVEYGFTGQRFDPETGLYYFKNRYYSPDVGRFIQPDPVGRDGLNRYAYVGNSPSNFVDPLGLTMASPTGISGDALDNAFESFDDIEAAVSVAGDAMSLLTDVYYNSCYCSDAGCTKGCTQNLCSIICSVFCTKAFGCTKNCSNSCKTDCCPKPCEDGSKCVDGSKTPCLDGSKTPCVDGSKRPCTGPGSKLPNPSNGCPPPPPPPPPPPKATNGGCIKPTAGCKVTNPTAGGKIK